MVGGEDTLSNVNAVREQFSGKITDIVTLIENCLSSGIRRWDQTLGVDGVPQQLGTLLTHQKLRFCNSALKRVRSAIGAHNAIPPGSAASCSASRKPAT